MNDELNLFLLLVWFLPPVASLGISAGVLALMFFFTYLPQGESYELIFGSRDRVGGGEADLSSSSSSRSSLSPPYAPSSRRPLHLPTRTSRIRHSRRCRPWRIWFRSYPSLHPRSPILPLPLPPPSPHLTPQPSLPPDNQPPPPLILLQPNPRRNLRHRPPHQQP